MTGTARRAAKRKDRMRNEDEASSVRTILRSAVTVTWLRRSSEARILRRLRAADLIVTRYGKPHLVLLSLARFQRLQKLTAGGSGKNTPK